MKTTSTNPKPINLRPREARRLADAGSVLVVRPMEPQPRITKGQWEWSGPRPEPLAWLDDGRNPAGAWLWSPFGPPGSKLWGRETHWRRGSYATRTNMACTSEKRSAFFVAVPSAIKTAEGPGSFVRFDDPGNKLHWKKCVSSQMPRWASRFPDLVVASVEARRLQTVTEEEARLSGYEDALDPNDRVQYDSGGNYSYCPEHGYRYGLMGEWDRDNPKAPWASDPWCWFAWIRKGGDT